jgi:dTDP-glucose 4,6-dehydratase
MRPHDGRAIPTFIRQALEEKPLTVFGEGSQTRSFCYVSDLVEGFLRLIECPYHDPVNLGNPGEFTILELVELLIQITGSRSQIVYEALPQDDPAVRRPDITRARELLGWEPTIELREGLLMTLAGMGAEVPLPG